MFENARIREHEGKTYVIRDIWSNGSDIYQKDDRLVRCEYAVKDGSAVVWKPCAEGVMFADIEPYEVA